MRHGRRRWISVAVCVAVVAGCREGELLNNPAVAFDVSPGTIDFGPTALGEQRHTIVRVGNRGAARLSVTSITSTLPLVAVPDFTAFELPAGEEREVAVIFAPQVEGAVSGVLQLQTDSDPAGKQVGVSGLGVSALAEVRTAAVDFGAVPLNTVKMGELVVANPRSVPVRVQVTLGGADADEFSSTACAGPLNLAAGEVRSVPVAFQPTRLGVAQAVASLSLCPACPQVQVPLGGSGIASLLDISPLVVDFGRVPVGSSADAQVTVRNLGSIAFDFTGARLLNNAGGAFALTSVPTLPNGRLEPGMTVEIALRFTPRISGPVSGVLLQLDARPAGSGAPGPKLPVLGGGGTPCLLISPAPLDFGTVPQGMTSTLWLELFNRCRDQIEVSGQSLSTQQGGYFSLPAGATPIFISGGATTRLGVSFIPRAGSSNSAGVLTLRVRQPEGSFGTEQVPLLGAATALPACSYELTPPALDFGAVPVGASVTMGLSLRNTGTSACFLSSMQVASGSDPELTADVMGSRLLQPGAAATLRVRFQPSGEGAFAGLAEAWVNSPTAGHPTAALSGSGTRSCFTLAPATVDFGLAKLGCPARTRTVIGYNRCQGPVTVGPTTLEAAPGTPLSLTGGAQGQFSIPAGQSASWTVQYAPTAEADAAAALRVQALGTTLTAGVVGTARAQPTKTDHFVQQGQGKVDVLFVIDNSGSMMEEQTGLAQNFAAFLSGAQQQQVDYHIGVTTTGIEPSPSGWSQCPGGVDGGEGGRLFPANNSSLRIITRQTPNAPQVFANNVSVGICHWDEKGLAAAQRALSAPLVNSADDPSTPVPNDGNLGFLRPDAKLALVFVTDEEDFSMGTVDSYETFFRAVKGNDPTMLVISAIVGPANLASCSTASSSGLRYITLAQRTGGLVESICTQDWSRSLQNISIGVFSPRRRFPLSQVPADPAQVSVRVNDTAVTSGWTYEAATNSVLFDQNSVPGIDATIDITYPLGC